MKLSNTLEGFLKAVSNTNNHENDMCSLVKLCPEVAKSTTLNCDSCAFHTSPETEEYLKQTIIKLKLIGE